MALQMGVAHADPTLVAPQGSIDAEAAVSPLSAQDTYRALFAALRASNWLEAQSRIASLDKDDPELLTTPQLLADPRPDANAQLHARLTPPLLALAFALLTLPLSRSSPRQTRYGRVMLGFLAYLVCINLMFIGTRALADGRLPGLLGLWWLTLPLLALAVWMYQRDGRLAQPRRVAT